jgi:protein SCO1/2
LSEKREVIFMKYAKFTLVFILSAVFALSPAHAKWLGKEDKDIHERHRAMQEMGEKGEAMYVDITLHDEELLTRDGKKVKFVSDVIGDRLVAITFVYTNCTTICPVYQAIFADLQKLLGDRLGKDVVLITMSLDPTRDIPPRMKIEAAKWNAKPEWVHLTGKKPVMDKVLQGLDAYFADFTQHPPMALVGDGKAGKWKRYNGFPKPGELLAMLDGFKMARSGEHHEGHHEDKAGSGEQKAGEDHKKHHEMHHEGHDESKAESSKQKAEDHVTPETKEMEHEKHHDMKPEGHQESKAESREQRADETVTEEEKARDYFTDLPVFDQEGNRLKFYSDVLKDRVVLITMYYTDCGLACPVTMQKLKDVEAVIGDRLGEDIFFVGLSVDSGNDTPEMVKEFLEEYDAYKEGYIFLTGEKRVLDHIIYKLGQYRPDIEYHSTIMIVGNVKTGHWAKVNPTHPPSTIAVRLKILADEG